MQKEEIIFLGGVGKIPLDCYLTSSEKVNARGAEDLTWKQNQKPTE